MWLGLIVKNWIQITPLCYDAYFSIIKWMVCWKSFSKTYIVLNLYICNDIQLKHCSQLTYTCISKLAIIGSGKSLSSIHSQAISEAMLTGYAGYVCINQLVITDSGNGLLPVQCQTIPWHKADMFQVNACEISVCQISAILPKLQYITNQDIQQLYLAYKTKWKKYRQSTSHVHIALLGFVLVCLVISWFLVD